ncbi:hypothetical protein BI308_25875 [Roseofilum reptotaenium AO1-A]|uniref:Uncharacterized protein n=1 Tax=Roseofilum reptotaenium AO1-A TaxID=1925591 RepID=A0A1L9QCB5_9CYAN|nr:hypothetical protein BI308_25875 [Roseofilum reptotaenium AO1-A]
MRMIKQWTGANNTAIRVPGNPFISNDGIEGIVPTGFNAFMENKIIRSQPELIWHFMDCLDGFFGQFPFTIKVPRRIREAAEQSGENLPVNVTVHNLEDAITEIIKLNMNLQDDERTIKALGMRAVLEAYQAREEAYKARNRIEVVIDWLGFKYKQVTKKLRASFTIPGLVSPDIANLIGGGGFTAFSIPGWEEEMGKDTLPTDDYADKQLDKFVEPSTNPVKAYELESSTEDLMDMMVDVKQAISIIKHSFTVSVGGSEDLEENLNKYLKDFETKVNQGTRAVKKAKGITEEPESLEDTDRYKQKDWRKFLEFTEEGYLPPDGIYRSPDGSQITIRTSGDNALPFNRTRQERPKIKDLTVE